MVLVRPLSSYDVSTFGVAVSRDVSPLSVVTGSTAAWMHAVPNARRQRITGEKFIFDVRAGEWSVCWCLISLTE